LKNKDNVGDEYVYNLYDLFRRKIFLMSYNLCKNSKWTSLLLLNILMNTKDKDYSNNLIHIIRTLYQLLNINYTQYFGENITE